MTVKTPSLMHPLLSTRNDYDFSNMNSGAPLVTIEKAKKVSSKAQYIPLKNEGKKEKSTTYSEIRSPIANAAKKGNDLPNLRHPLLSTGDDYDFSDMNSGAPLVTIEKAKKVSSKAQYIPLKNEEKKESGTTYSEIRSPITNAAKKGNDLPKSVKQPSVSKKAPEATQSKNQSEMSCGSKATFCGLLVATIVGVAVTIIILQKGNGSSHPNDSPAPSFAPTMGPTAHFISDSPTMVPTLIPTIAPSVKEKTYMPTPSQRPTIKPSLTPTMQPSIKTLVPTTKAISAAPTSAPGTVEMGVWYIDWTSWFPGPPYSIPAGTNVINIFVGELLYDADGNPTAGGFGNMNLDQLDAFVTYCKEQNPDMKVKISLGGGGGSYDNTWDKLTSENIQSWAQGLKDFCDAHGLDGVDFDYEELKSAAQEALVGQLIKAFKLLGSNLQASLCTNAGFSTWQSGVQNVLDAAVSTLGKCPLDRLYVMSYYDPITSEEGWITDWANWIFKSYNCPPSVVGVGIDTFDAHAYDPVEFKEWALGQGYSVSWWAYDPAHPADYPGTRRYLRGAPVNKDDWKSKKVTFNKNPRLRGSLENTNAPAHPADYLGTRRYLRGSLENTNDPSALQS